MIVEESGVMKKILKFIVAVIAIAYIGVIVFVTGCLLFYNQYKVTQINDKTFIIIDDESDMYKDGDLVIFTRNPNDEIGKSDEIFFYEVTNGTINVVSGTVTKSEKITPTETTFTINNTHIISSESVIGKTKTAIVYPNIGKILYIFESRFGFLLLVILPALIFFFYEIYRLVQDIKTAKVNKVENVSEAVNVVPAASPASNVAPAPVTVNTVEDAHEDSPVTNTAESVSDALDGANAVLEQTEQKVETETAESLDLNDNKEE